MSSFLGVQQRGGSWQVVVPTLSNLILFEHKERQIIEDQLDHYQRLFDAYDRWKISTIQSKKAHSNGHK